MRKSVNAGRVAIFAAILIISSIAYAQDKPAEGVPKPVPSTTEGKASSGESLYDTVKSGGAMMIPILAIGVFAMTIIIERSIFYLKSGMYSRKILAGYLSQKASASGAKYKEEMEAELRGETQIYVNRMEKGLALLNGLGNIAPILGFLGTVIGMIDAFAAIAAATTVNAKVVAVGIQVALVTTAGGLMVAAPAIIAYSFFLHLVQRIYSGAEEEIAEKIKDLPRLSSAE